MLFFSLPKVPRAKRFGKRFTFVQEGSTSARVGNAGIAATHKPKIHTPTGSLSIGRGRGVRLALLNIKVPKNGYCLVYISNESDEPVYFDNLQVRHDRGRILEEMERSGIRPYH
jgi:hypothetical protein